MELLSKVEDGDILLVVAETGEWLTRDDVVAMIKEKEVNIFPIIADRSWMEELEKHYGDRLQPPKQIPWWSHNRHMTILCRNEKPICSIYFKRRLREHYVSPVFLGKEGSEAILESFQAYCFKQPWLEKRPILGRKKLENQARFFDILTGKIDRKPEE